MDVEDALESFLEYHFQNRTSIHHIQFQIDNL